MGAGFSIQFERSGGIGGLVLRTRVVSDQLEEPERTEMQELVDRVVDRVGTYRTGPPLGADQFQYDLVIDRDGDEAKITAHDGALPPELKTLCRQLTAIARSSVNSHL